MCEAVQGPQRWPGLGRTAGTPAWGISAVDNVCHGAGQGNADSLCCVLCGDSLRARCGLDPEQGDCSRAYRDERQTTPSKEDMKLTTRIVS